MIYDIKVIIPILIEHEQYITQHVWRYIPTFLRGQEKLLFQSNYRWHI